MKLIINGVDIIDDVNLLEAVYEDYATASSSRLYLKFDDADSLWQNWQLKNNDEISINIQTVRNKISADASAEGVGLAGNGALYGPGQLWPDHNPQHLF